MEDSEKESKPFFIDIKNNYGTTDNAVTNVQSSHPTFHESGNCSTFYYVHGKALKVGHCHRERQEGVDTKARKKLIIASALCLVFMTAEIVGGILSNSLAIATDAAHLLTDFAAFMISLFAIWLAGRPSTQRLSFGWYRAEVIGALVSVVLIWAITAILVWLAIERIINKSYELEANIMLITSALGILFNLIMGFQLTHGHSHGFSHGHSHGRPNIQHSATESDVIHSANTSKKTDIYNKASLNSSNLKTKSSSSKNKSRKNDTAVYTSNNDDVNVNISKSQPTLTQKIIGNKLNFENMNVRAAFIHVVGDVVQSIGVFIAALIIYFKPNWGIVDPICTFIFSIIVLITTFKIVKDAVLVLMEATPDYYEYTEVMNIFLSIDGVERVHNLRIWALNINKIALSAHLAVRPGRNPKNVLEEANSAIQSKYNFFETTIQIEDFTPEMEECKQCEVPNN